MELNASLYGGDIISGDYNMSICIGGTYNGKEALLTCGHGNEWLPDITRYGVRVGKVKTYRANRISGETSVAKYGDFAIIEVDSSYYEATNKVKGASSSVINIGGVYSSIPVGTTIYKYGATTGYSSGYVLATQQTLTSSFNNDMYYLSGLTLSFLSNASGTPVADGDSGGAVYIKDGSIYKIHGCVTGSYAVASGRNMTSTPIYYPMSVGFTPYTN